MTEPLANPRDPVGWSALIVAIFAAFVFYRLGTPTRFYFDEVHYINDLEVIQLSAYIGKRRS